MTTHTLPQAEPYVDRKRYAWLLSVFVPFLVGSGPLLIEWTGHNAWAWLPIAFLYLMVPVLDLLLGEDRSNPPESAVPALEADRYYRYITYAVVPILWLVFAGTVAYLCTHDLPWHAQLALILGAGLCGGFGINLGHELGHKNNALERWLAKIAAAITASWPRLRIRRRRAWARTSTPSSGAKCPARSNGPGVWSVTACNARASRSGPCTTKSFNRP